MNKKIFTLVGSPNSGKTTLYNWLTGSHSKAVNYPGSTVEVQIGDLKDHWSKEAVHVQDTPGTYSLFPKSADEEVALKALYKPAVESAERVVVVVVDSTQLERHLLLAMQVKAAAFPLVVALTMHDLLEKNKVRLNLRELEQFLGCAVVPIDGRFGKGIPELVQSALKAASKKSGVPLKHWTPEQFTENQKLTARLAGQTVDANVEKVFLNTERLDAILLHPIFGIFLFVAVMSTLFISIFTWSGPLMDLIDSGFSQLAEIAESLGPGTLWANFLSQGVVASLGAVLIFVPQIFILFLGLGFLEATGYLARAATLIDRPFSKLGMSGRSFVPVLSGFACAVPAMMATRNLSSARDRWITNFILPLMQCSARLPVFALLLGFLFKGEPGWKPGLAMAAIYFGGLLIGAIAAAVVHRIVPDDKKSFFMMELPIYRLPRPTVLLRQCIRRTLAYVRRAGPIIFVFAVLLWLGVTFPQTNPETQLENSYMGQAGQVLEPIFKPMGVDWRVGVGLISAFAAREVFVSNLAVMFKVTGDEDSLQEGLLETMKSATFPDGSPIFTVGSVIALIVFFMIALQCMSTVAIAVKESGSWKFAMSQLVIFNLVAYVLAVVIFQLI
jgi:ferrous iron transport protein B